LLATLEVLTRGLQEGKRFRIERNIAQGRCLPSVTTLSWDAFVIDPRTLQPLDTATIVASVKRTNRVIVVHEAVRFGGLGAEIAAQIQEEAFDYLDGPVARIGAPFSPVPFSPVLEQHYIPDAAAIVDGIRGVLLRPLVGEDHNGH
jgi:pyruvate/2-oxoglutarate/acetoin dehydrogenase E1 component